MQREVSDGVPFYQFDGLGPGEDVVHAVLTRIGGVSLAPFATLNLGHTVGDDVAAVEENHHRALGVLGLSVEHVVSPYQVHGARVRLVGAGHRGTVQPACDALVTNEPGVPLLLRFADCVPVLFYDRARRAVGVAHAGWRGVAANVVGETVRTLVERVKSDPSQLWAGIGPAIGPCCYDVAPEVLESVRRACPPDASVSRVVGEKVFLDMPAAVRAQLRAAGVGSIEDSDLCTACCVQEFFSHRVERGRTGRFGVLAGLTR